MIDFHARCSQSARYLLQLGACCLSVFLLGALSCSGSDGADGAPGKDFKQTLEKDLARDADLPGLVIDIVSLGGASGQNGRFAKGDRLSVTFTVAKKDATPIMIEDLDFGAILVAGPTSNYQPVLARKSDLVAASVENAGGSYTYTFADPIPATYLPPLNDTASFGAVDGEMQGQDLVDGTYTVAIEAFVNYTIVDESFRDATNVTKDFLIGATTELEAREVVTMANCNQCHEELRAHGTIRRNVSHCLLCHTSGSEDKNDPATEGGTPGVAIDFRVLIHKIHSGKHLPSVLGVTTNADGSRKYDATPKPYKVVGRSTHDYSEIGFPLWPNLTNPMPRDFGYTALSSTNKGLENTIRSGVTSCDKCHGDPDGDGPLPAPAQGNLAYTNPTRMACGSCHDDVDWDKPYTANLLTMAPQPNNAVCAQCHNEQGAALSVRDAHKHPLLNPATNAGVEFSIVQVTESGTNNNNGKFDPGEKIKVDFLVRDWQGLGIDASTLNRMEVVVSGPTSNSNIVLEQRFPTAALSGSSPSTHLPDRQFLEFVGDATGSLGSFTTSLVPHWNVSGGDTEVWVVDSKAVGSPLTAAAVAGQNYVDVVNGALFSRGDYIVIDDGLSAEEYLRVQYVDTNRLWFSSTHSPYDQPTTRLAHGVSAVVQPVTLVQKTVTTDYTLNATTGTITEVTLFGSGKAVLVSYTTDFVIPANYPTALNDSPDLGTTVGKWAGMSLVDGTYTLSMWGEKSFTVSAVSETTSYNSVAPAAQKLFLVGSATEIEPRMAISSAQNCNGCHNDIWFHGSHRRGFDACMACHGTAGSEDRPPYVAANAPATTGVSIDFRRLLHKIHMGSDLANASTYTVVGFGSGYPNNYSAYNYDKIAFPVQPGGTKQCQKCHGPANEVWVEPAMRNHPMQPKDTRSWFVACGSCHDSGAAHAHMDAQTSVAGAESCAVCHGRGKEWSVELMHKAR